VTGVREGGSLNVSAAGSGSGSRYAAADALGEYAFWIKGDEARFDQPGEDALACSITKPG
jgi:membrane-bound inhibitor of C-type lysozyme